MWTPLLVAAVCAGEATLLPPPPLPGATPAVLQVVSATPGVRIRFSDGKVLDTTPVAGGVIVRYLPPDVATATPVEVAIRARGDKDNTLSVITVVPGHPREIDVRADVGLVDPGATTTLRFRPSGSPAQGAALHRLLATTNLGTIGPITPDPQGGWMATYTPPVGLTAPARAIVLATDTASPGEIRGVAVIALTARRDVTIPATPGSSNTLDIGGRRFGPAEASPAGTASFDVTLHPDHPVASWTSTRPDGRTEVTPTPMPVGAAPAVAIAPLPAQIPAQTPIPIGVLCRDAAGEACALSAARVDAPGGLVSAPAPAGDAWTLTWTAPVGAATLSVSVGDSTGTWRGAGVAGSVDLALVAIPAALPPGSSDVTIEARLRTAAGSAAPGRGVALVARDATVIAKPRDKGDGTYVATYRLDKGVPYARVVGASIGAPTGLPARRMVGWPTQSSLPSDGKSTAMIVIAVEDALGAPVPDVSLTLAVPVGDATVPPTAKTGRDGLARVEVRAGTRAGPIAVTASGGGVAATATLWQGDDPAALVAIGPEDDLDALRRWQDRVPALFIGRAAAPVVAQRPVAPPPVKPPVAPPVLGEAPAVAASGETAPTPRPAAVERPRLRLHAGVFIRPGMGASTPQGEDARPFAPEASWAISPKFGAAGLHLDGEGWTTSRRLGVDLRARGHAIRYDLRGVPSLAVPVDVEGGLRWRAVDAGPWSVAPGLGAAWLTGQAIVYTDATRSDAEARTFGAPAARLGAWARYERAAWLVQVDVEALFAARPTAARAELSIDLPLTQALVLTGSAAVDGRWLRLSDPAWDGASVHVRQFNQEIRLGIGVVRF